jgi:hypothetical protein
LGEADICKLYRKVAYSHTGEKSAVFTRLRCKQWSCSHCARKNASIWRAFLKEKLPEVSDEWYLVTFTAHPNTTTKQGSFNNIRNNIEALLKRAKRVFGSLEYVRTFERHPTSNRIHSHYIIAGLSPYVICGYSIKHRPVAYGVTVRKGRSGIWSVRTWFKINAHEVGMGHIVDVQLIKGEPLKAVLYVTKYLTKQQQDIGIKGLRHVQTSRGVGSPQKEKDQIWNVAPYIVPKMFAPNASIVDLNTGEIIDNRYWEVHNFYPYDD